MYSVWWWTGFKSSWILGNVWSMMMFIVYFMYDLCILFLILIGMRCWCWLFDKGVFFCCLSRGTIYGCFYFVNVRVYNVRVCA